jgi:hypothetical protein
MPVLGRRPKASPDLSQRSQVVENGNRLESVQSEVNR